LAYLSGHQRLKPAYTFEMVDARDHPSQDARDGFTIIDRVTGGAIDTAVVIDAAKLGSAAHRVLPFWTNAAQSGTLKQRYAQFDREWVNDRKRQDVLRNGRRVNMAPTRRSGHQGLLSDELSVGKTRMGFPDAGVHTPVLRL
jgi:hypothetical protein